MNTIPKNIADGVIRKGLESLKYNIDFHETINGYDFNVPIFCGTHTIVRNEKTASEPRIVVGYLPPNRFAFAEMHANIMYDCKMFYKDFFDYELVPSYAWVTDGKRNFYYDFIRQIQIAKLPVSGEHLIEDMQEGIYRNEIPSIREFVESPEYLNMKGLAYVNILNVLEQWDKPEHKDCILICGKGSGKSTACGLITAYAAWKLMNMIDYRRTLGFPIGEIVLLNLSINSEEAKNVFFADLKMILKKSKCFKGRYKDLTTSIDFGNNIKAYSGHSKAKSWEGYSVFSGVLDEYDKFLNTSGKNVAEECYNLLVTQSISRFPYHAKIYRITSLSDYPSPASALWDGIKKVGKKIDILEY